MVLIAPLCTDISKGCVFMFSNFLLFWHHLCNYHWKQQCIEEYLYVLFIFEVFLVSVFGTLSLKRSYLAQLFNWRNYLCSIYFNSPLQQSMTPSFFFLTAGVFASTLFKPFSPCHVGSGLFPLLQPPGTTSVGPSFSTNTNSAFSHQCTVSDLRKFLVTVPETCRTYMSYW